MYKRYENPKANLLNFANDYRAQARTNEYEEELLHLPNTAAEKHTKGAKIEKHC